MKLPLQLFSVTILIFNVHLKIASELNRNRWTRITRYTQFTLHHALRSYRIIVKYISNPCRSFCRSWCCRLALLKIKLLRRSEGEREYTCWIEKSVVRKILCQNSELRSNTRIVCLMFQMFRIGERSFEIIRPRCHQYVRNAFRVWSYHLPSEILHLPNNVFISYLYILTIENVWICNRRSNLKSKYSYFTLTCTSQINVF